MTTPAVERVEITPEAAAVLRRLRVRHGPLMFHQSGGCCDGSAPMCFPRSEFIVGDEDVLLGVLHDGDAETPVWISGSQFALWKHTQLLLDVVAGRGAGFSVEAPEGVRFLTRSRVFDAAEQEWLSGCPAPRGRDGPEGTPTEHGPVRAEHRGAAGSRNPHSPDPLASASPA